MDEITALSQLRADIADPTPEALRAARTRLENQNVRAAVLVARPRPRYRRRALIGVAAAAVLATGAYALTSSGGTGSPGTPRAESSRPGAPATPKTTTSGAPRYVNAAQLLDKAAANALTADEPALAPGQYRYFRSHSYLTSSIDQPPNHGAYIFTESSDETWQPAASTGWTYYRSVSDISDHYPNARQRRYAASSPGGIPSRSVYWDVQHGNEYPVAVYPPGARNIPPGKARCIPEPCSQVFVVWDAPDRASVAKLPHDPTALRASLFSWANRQAAETGKYHRSARANSLALGAIKDVLDQDLASAVVRSALFEVAKTIPGVTLSGSMANYDGTRGLAVGLVDPSGVQLNLIFDPENGTYLGERQVVTRPSSDYHLRAGTVVEWTAISTKITGRPTLPKGAKLPH